MKAENKKYVCPTLHLEDRPRTPPGSLCSTFWVKMVEYRFNSKTVSVSNTKPPLAPRGLEAIWKLLHATGHEEVGIGGPIMALPW